MNCASCQSGWTRGQQRTTTRAPQWRSPAQIGTAVSTRLKRAEENDELFNRLTVAGRGEPTLHPQFEDIVGRLVDIRDRLAPTLRLACSRLKENHIG